MRSVCQRACRAARVRFPATRTQPNVRFRAAVLLLVGYALHRYAVPQASHDAHSLIEKQKEPHHTDGCVFLSLCAGHPIPPGLKEGICIGRPGDLARISGQPRRGSRRYSSGKR